MLLDVDWGLTSFIDSHILSPLLAVASTVLITVSLFVNKIALNVMGELFSRDLANRDVGSTAGFIEHLLVALRR